MNIIVMMMMMVTMVVRRKRRRTLTHRVEQGARAAHFEARDIPGLVSNPKSKTPNRKVQKKAVIKVLMILIIRSRSSEQTITSLPLSRPWEAGSDKA